MEKLIIRNFGPIKNAEVEIKKINVLIGHTASGKSTVAKLYSIFNSVDFFYLSQGEYDGFVRLLEKYNIDFPFKTDTEIAYNHNDFYWIIGEGIFKTNNVGQDFFNKASEKIDFEQIKDGFKIKNNNYFDPIKASLLDDLKLRIKELILKSENSIYIPAERSLLTTYTNSIFSLISNNIDIPYCIQDFGSLYQKAKKHFKTLDIPFVKGLKVDFSSGGSDDMLDVGQEDKISLSRASTGLQSLIPLLTVFDYYCDQMGEHPNIITIEEPELNLFPSVQKELVEHTIAKINATDNKIMYTTHSPYILSTLDNLILAYQTGQDEPEQTALIVPKDRWVDFRDVSSYFFSSDGEVINILDEATQTISAEWIDSISNVLGDDFDKLLSLKK